MSDLQDNVVQVRVEGTEEGQAALRQLGEIGAEAFAQIAEAASHGDFTGIATAIGGELAGAFTKAAQEAVEFVHSTAEVAEQLNNLSSISGLSVNQLQALAAQFAIAGVGTQGFERSMVRLSVTIAQSWAAIQESARTTGIEETNAQIGIQEAALNTDKAYQNLSDTMEKVAQTAVHDSQGIVDARLNLQKALNTQSKGLGQDTSASDKALQQAEQANAVIKAREALYDANQKKADDEASANLKIREAALGVQKAIQGQAEAQEKAFEISLKDIPQLSQDIKNVADGVQKWGDNAKLAAVSGENLTRAIILAASAGGKEPDAAAVLKELSALFDDTKEHAIDMGTKVEIVTRLMSSGFRAGQASAAQLIEILSKGPEELEKFKAEIEKSPTAVNTDDINKLKDLNAAFAELQATVSQVAVKFGALAAPTLTAVFNAVRQAILQISVALSDLGTWIDKTFGEGVSSKIAGFAAAFVVITPAVLAIGLALGGIVVAVGSVIGSIALFGVAFGVAFVAATAFIAVWPQIKSAIASVVDWFEGAWKTVIDGIEKAIEKAKEFLGIKPTGPQTQNQTSPEGKDQRPPQTAEQQAATNAAGSVPLSDGGIKIGEAADKTQSAASDQSAAADKTSGAADTLTNAGQALQQAAQALTQASQGKGGGDQSQGRASGGHIRGPGGPTEDKAGLFRLSDGEYVVRTAAVQHYGVGLFEALNSLAVGGFATGGRVGGGASVPVTSIPSHGGSSVLNLTIDGNHFNGLRAPGDVASKLKNYAVTRQSTAAGKNPSWMR
jgi:hypothetical protein